MKDWFSTLPRNSGLLGGDALFYSNHEAHSAFYADFFSTLLRHRVGHEAKEQDPDKTDNDKCHPGEDCNHHQIIYEASHSDLHRA